MSSDVCFIRLAYFLDKLYWMCNTPSCTISIRMGILTFSYLDDLGDSVSLTAVREG